MNRRYTNISDEPLPFRRIPPRQVDGEMLPEAPAFALGPGESLVADPNAYEQREALVGYMRQGRLSEEEISDG